MVHDRRHTRQNVRKPELRALLGWLLAAGCCACTPIANRPQVIVIIDAEASVRERIDRVDVEVETGSGSDDDWVTSLTRRFVPEPGVHGWPLRLSLLPSDVDAHKRYAVTARAKDANGILVAQVRAVSEYVQGSMLELALRFDAECANRGEPCGEMLSCQDGKCIDPFVQPPSSPTADAGRSETPGASPSAPCTADAACSDSTCADAGGCDPLVACTSDAGQSVCGPCPAGYTGSGQSGCVSALIDLQVTGGSLQPAFSPDVHEYTLDLPLLANALVLQPTAAKDVTLRIDGKLVESGSRWTAPSLDVGDSRALAITVSAKAHASQTYALNVRHMLNAPAYLKAGNAGADDQLGTALAVSGDTLVAGAPFEDGGADTAAAQSNEAVKDSGAIYVFVRAGDAWIQQAYLKADAPVEGANFGMVLALEGDRIAVGARNDVGGGAVYVFERAAAAWRQTSVLRIENAASSLSFGCALALHGERLAIGASGEDSGAADSGAVFVFEHAATGWVLKARVKAAKPGPLDWLGSSVALDDDTLVSGATGQFVDGNAGGAVHVFVRRGDSWNEQGLLPAQPLEVGALFGVDVAISGNTVAAGAFNGTAGLTSGAVFVFVRDDVNGSFRQEAVIRASNPMNGDYFGLRLALSGDTLLVGASRESSMTQAAGDMPGASLERSGAAYVFRRSSGVWNQWMQLTAPKPAAQDQFGYSVALSGQTIAIGAIGDAAPASGTTASPSSGALRVFE